MKRFSIKILSFALLMTAFCQNIQAQTCITITEPAALVPSGTPTNVLCKGASTGAIAMAATGGTAPYLYSKDAGTTYLGAGMATFSSLAAGTYAIRVKDANNCIADVNVTVTEPATLPTVSITATENSCTANDNQVTTGSAFNMTAAATGGTPAGAAPLYTYAWSNTLGSTAAVTATVNATTTYTVTATDANNCTATATATATVITGPTVSITGLASAYCKDATAVTLAGTATPAGGTFTIDATAATSFDPSALTAANHSVIYSYTDANGCNGTNTKAVTVNALPAFTLASTNVTCNGAADGTITITVTGGATPYEYSKDDGGTYTTPAAATTQAYTGLAPALYKPTVRDTNGCVKKCQ
jgi:SprB repeat